MAIESVSGRSGAAVAPVRTNSQLVKKEEGDSEEKASLEKTAEERQEEKFDKAKGVDEVDTKA